MSAASSSSEATASAAEAAENNLANPAVSERFRPRMRPCQEPVPGRTKCPCCGRNFREASECLAKFRDSLQPQQQAAALAGNSSSSPSAQLASVGVSGIVHDFSETERAILLSDDFLRRLLARCGCDFKRSQERLLMAAAVHRKYALDGAASGCRVCADSPGYHSFRQVGFDRAGRPVLYTCLNQDLETGTQPEQIRAYFLHLILAVREAERTIPDGQHSLVLVFDTTGLGMHHVRKDSVAQFGEMLRYFPSRMSYALLLNMNTMTRFLLKPIIHLTGHQDDVLVLPANQVEKQLLECFDAPLVQWMTREIERNKQPKMPFWLGPDGQQQQHDPRGEASYVENYVKTRHRSGHRPHPSIVAANPSIHGN